MAEALVCTVFWGIEGGALVALEVFVLFEVGEGEVGGLEFVEGEAEAVCALDFDGDVAEDEEGAVFVSDVFEAVQRRDERAR